ncbi:hypothetical protein JCGZ_11836 [Jatropha curcas]|uniref:Uncharacterized protein n=1 Tax=Jatropha curcas TaxID=180498 RepID=A0A067LFC0_JATCU|nr:hypothetical protein JCGZ_11836 [Jatropha curcas]
MSYETSVTIVVHHMGVFIVRKGKVSYDGENKGNPVQIADGSDIVSNEDGVGFQEIEFDVGEALCVFETEVGSNNPEGQPNETGIEAIMEQ